MTDFAHLPLPQITASHHNPRKTFDAGKLAELAESIKTSGVHQPILVRPLPGDRVLDTDRAVQYEIVAGERRYRASQLADALTIPAMIRPLTDDQALEIMLVENLQRDDLTELEEAEGYESLMQHSSLTADQVASKIGKSRSYVYGRLKLLDLCQEARGALRDRTIDASRALLVARIPDSKLQIKALNVATNPVGGGADPMGARAFSTWLQQNVMLRLERAPFQITDAHLVPAAGSCKDCPKRTGANPDLFADVPNADICTDPACHQAKEQAHRAQLVATAHKKGMRVIDGTEAKEVFNSRGSYDGSVMSGYSRLDQIRNDVIGANGSTLRKLLASVDLAAQGVQPVLIEHPRTKELIEAVPTAEAEALLITQGLLRQSRKAESVEREIESLKKDIDRRTARESRVAIWKALVQAVHNTTPFSSDEVLRAWLINQCDVVEDDDLVAAFNLPDIEGGDRIETRARLAAQRASREDLLRATIILMMADDQGGAFMFGDTERPMPLFNAVATLTGVDTAAIVAETKATIKAQVAEEIKALKAQLAPEKAEKPSTPDDPAAPAGKGAGKGAKAKNTRPAAPAVVREDEARQGIAAAMQGVEGQPVDGPDGAQAGPQPAGELAIDAFVKVLPTATGPKQRPWIGKTGIVRGKIGSQAWDVCFTASVARPITKKAVAEYVGFDASELEVVES